MRGAERGFEPRETCEMKHSSKENPLKAFFREVVSYVKSEVLAKDTRTVPSVLRLWRDTPLSLSVWARSTLNFSTALIEVCSPSGFVTEEGCVSFCSRPRSELQHHLNTPSFWAPLALPT